MCSAAVLGNLARSHPLRMPPTTLCDSITPFSMTPPPHTHRVKEAMNEINAARRMRVAAAEKAEAEKVAVVKSAEAEAEAKFLQVGVVREIWAYARAR